MHVAFVNYVSVTLCSISFWTKFDGWGCAF